MALKKIRLELARTAAAPEGDRRCGYEFIAPLDAQGRLDARAWPHDKSKCTVRRFWADQDDEPIFRFATHAFIPGEYVSITEHDGVERPFRVTVARPLLQVTRARSSATG